MNKWDDPAVMAIPISSSPVIRRTHALGDTESCKVVKQKHLKSLVPWEPMAMSGVSTAGNDKTHGEVINACSE